MADMDRFMFEIDQRLKRLGLGGMDDETLRVLSQSLQHPEVQQQIQRGQLTVERIVGEVQAASRASAEGGDIADRTGRHTGRVRQQIGIQPQSLTLGPVGGGMLRNPVGTTRRPGPFGNQMNPVLDPSRLGTAPRGDRVFPRVPGGRLPTNQLLLT